MNRIRCSAWTAAAMALAIAATGAEAQDASRAVDGGGIKADGWMGKVDAREASRGNTIDDSILQMEGDAVHVKTGPAANYWHRDHRASGNFTVSATFTEPGYMAGNDHPHPYGLFIGGQNLATDNAKLLYCSAYGYGAFIVRGFGPDAFQMNGRRAERHEAVNSAAGPDEPVVQDIAIRVAADTVACWINGTEVASYPRSEIVMDGRLDSTDGYVGVRFGHNTEARITGMKIETH